MSAPRRISRKKKVVVDASVILKWLLDDEESVPQAIALRDESLRTSSALVAPSLWVYEVTNGLVTAAKRDRISPTDVRLAIDDILLIGIQSRTPPVQRVASLAIAHRLAAYDSAYLALAEQENCELWTGDYAFYKTMRAKLPWVKWIGDYPLPKRS